jgi:glycosyltransferase involved in cell wall biosynthesis
MTAPQVSVIIPTRDRWPFLDVAVWCALSQEDVSVEVIVVNDGSREPPPDSALLRDPRVRVVGHKVSRGLSAARNTGMAAVTGSWVAWLDDDDLWAPDKLARQLASAAEETTMIYAAGIAVDRSLHVTAMWPAPAPEDLAESLVAANNIPVGSSNVVARADAVREVGDFDESLPHLQDWDMWMRLARVGLAASCDETLVAWVHHGHNMHLGAYAAMGEFDRLAAKHAAWTTAHGLSFDRAGFARYPGEILVKLGDRAGAYRHVLRHGLSPLTLANIRGSAGVLIGPRALRAYHRIRGRDVPTLDDPPWLVALRDDSDRLPWYEPRASDTPVVRQAQQS